MIDRGIIEILGPMGLTNLISKNAWSLSKLQSGFIYHYTFLILILCTVLLCMRQFWSIFSFVIDIKLFIIFLISFFFLIHSNNTK